MGCSRTADASPKFIPPVYVKPPAQGLSRGEMHPFDELGHDDARR
jgi:hypothetical protein